MSTTNRSGWFLRERGDPHQASFIELFFDLAFIVALTRFSQRLVHDLTWINVVQTLVLMAAVWWVWSVTAYSTDWYDPSEPLVQGLVLGVMFGELLMAAAVPHAFGSRGVLFAGAYLGIHIGRGFLLVWALRGHRLQPRTARVLIWFGVSAVPWLIGAFVAAPLRLVLWSLALGLDYVMSWLGWPTPRLGRSTPQELSVVGEHLTERYRQIFIIALGELILVSSIAYSDEGTDVPRSAAFALSFVNAVLLWRIYIVRAGNQLARGIDRAREPAKAALSASYSHMIMISGVVITAVGAEILIGQPLGGTTPAMAAVLVGGPVLFLVGRALFAITVYQQLPWLRFIGSAVIVAIAPFSPILPPLAVALAVTVALLLIALIPPSAGRERQSVWAIRTRW